MAAVVDVLDRPELYRRAIRGRESATQPADGRSDCNPGGRVKTPHRSGFVIVDVPAVEVDPRPRPTEVRDRLLDLVLTQIGQDAAESVSEGVVPKLVVLLGDGAFEGIADEISAAEVKCFCVQQRKQLQRIEVTPQGRVGVVVEK